MKEISKDKVYYGYFNDDKTTIQAYKVISIVFDIDTECYTLTLNIANDGVKKVYSKYWYFYTSPLNVVNNESDFYLGWMLWDLKRDNKSYVNDFKNALSKNGYEIDCKNKIVYWVFDKTNGSIESKSESIAFCSSYNFMVGKYNLFTQEFEGLGFNPKLHGRYKNIYKSKEECLKATMPKVVEFEDNTSKDVEISFNFNVTIKAKDAKDAQRKFNELMSKK